MFETMGSIEATKWSKEKTPSINPKEYASRQMQSKNTITRAETEDRKRENPEKVLLALNTSEIYEQIRLLENKHILKAEVKYCVEEGIAKTFKYAFYNEYTRAKDYIFFNICEDRTVEFWNQKIGKAWIMKLTNASPQEWYIDCVEKYADPKKQKCYKDIQDCLEQALDVCVR